MPALNKPLITVLTPTYNRAEQLKALFASLQKQSDPGFCWLVVDDGSQDNTKEVVQTFKKEARFPLEYVWKENGGKHTAINQALPSINTPLVFIVDSDDALTPDAIRTIKEAYALYGSEADLCGFSYLRQKPDGGLLSEGKVPQDGMKANFVDCRLKGGIGGDMAEVWFTKRLQEFPFPEFKGEKFLSEDVVWIPMARKYQMRFFNQAIYLSDYQADGLTRNRRAHNIASPNGCVYRAEILMGNELDFKSRAKGALQYVAYGLFANRSLPDLLASTKHRGLVSLALLPGLVLHARWKKQYPLKSNI